MCAVEYFILGPMAVRPAPDAAPLALGDQTRILLGRLLIDLGAAVSTDALADALWEDEPRADRRNGVQAAVKAARKLLGDTATPRRIIVNVGDGYRLVADPMCVDVERFKLLAARGHALAPRLPRAARAMLAEALGSWRGRLLGDHAERVWAAGHARELDAVRDRVEADLNEVRLALGEHAQLDGVLRRQILEHPLDEQRRSQFVRALDGAGRAAEATVAYRDAFRELGGLGPSLRALGDRIGRGLPPERPPAPAEGQIGSRPDDVLLCAAIAPPRAPRGERGMGRLCLIVDRHHGEPHPIADSGVIATYTDARDALQAARELAADARLRAAVGLHVGSVVQLGDRLAGSGPARCRQLARAAVPGQVLVSDDARARLEPSEELRDLGVQVFEDLAPGEPVFGLRADGGSRLAPNTLSRMEHNLPVQPTRFIGRDADLERLLRLVAGGELLTLVGAGGCGKTRLAVQLAARCIMRFPDGAWFAELAELDGAVQAHDVAATVASQLGVRAAPGETWTVTLQRHLSDRAALLVLDNCEQIHAACGEPSPPCSRAVPRSASSRRAAGGWVSTASGSGRCRRCARRPTRTPAISPTPSSYCSSAPDRCRRTRRRAPTRWPMPRASAGRWAAFRSRSSSPQDMSRPGGWPEWPSRSTR